MKMCMYQFFGTCTKPKCDLDATHYPNNLRCPRYVPVYVSPIMLHEKEERDERKKTKSNSTKRM